MLNITEHNVKTARIQTDSQLCFWKKHSIKQTYHLSLATFLWFSVSHTAKCVNKCVKSDSHMTWITKKTFQTSSQADQILESGDQRGITTENNSFSVSKMHEQTGCYISP